MAFLRSHADILFKTYTTLKPLKSQSQREIGAIDILHTLS